MSTLQKKETGNEANARGSDSLFRGLDTAELFVKQSRNTLLLEFSTQHVMKFGPFDNQTPYPVALSVLTVI